MNLFDRPVFKKYLESAFFKKTGTVVGGTVIAQLVLFLSVPVLTRLYEVPQFGKLGLFMLIGTLGFPVFCWRIEYEIGSAKTDKDAKHFLALCTIVGFASMIVFGPVIYFLSPFISLKDDFNLRQFLPLLLCYCYLVAIWNACSFYNIRLKEFKMNATINIIRACMIVLLSILLSWFTGNGMIFGLITGQGIGTCLILIKTTQMMELRFWHSAFFKPEVLKATLKQARKSVFYALPSTLSELAGYQIPQYAIGAFGATTFGWFSQANRILYVPIDVIGQSIRSVFWEAGGKIYREKGECKELFNKILIRLLGFSIIFFLAIFLAAPILFSWILGPNWINAGYYVRILIPMVFCRFITYPFSSLIYIAQKQKYQLFIQVVMFSLALLVFIYPKIDFDDASFCIGVFSAFHCIKYMWEFWYCRKIAYGKM